MKNKPTMQEELEHLRSANAFKDRLFSIIGHDLRTPFNNVKGLLALLDDDLIAAKDRKYLIGELREIIDTSLQTLDNLLGWASQKAYGSILNTKTKNERINLHELVHRIQGFLFHSASKKEITVVNIVPVEMYVNADLEQLSFVLRNLISNAIKFSYEKGEIIVAAAAANGIAEVSVIDSGMGMTQEAIRSLFQINTRSSRSGTRNEKGTGLGLIFCKEFVENNGGRIWVESDGQHGTTFKFTLQGI